MRFFDVFFLLAGDRGIGHRSRPSGLARDPASAAFAASGFLILHLLDSKNRFRMESVFAIAGDRGIEPLLRRLECLVLPLYESPKPKHYTTTKKKSPLRRSFRLLKLFLCLLEDDVLSLRLAVLLELDLLLNSLLVLAGNIHFSCLFISEVDEFIL